MTATLLLLAWLTPWLAVPWGRRRGWPLLAAALPALAAAQLLPARATLDLPWLLLGVSLGLDAGGRILLLTGTLVWLAAAAIARDTLSGPRAGRFRTFFLLAMGGNFLLLLAQDALTFYLGYAVMGLSAYGLVAHRPGTRRAARVYLAWTLAGEVALFTALVLLAAGAGGFDFATLRSDAPGPVALALLLIAFGIKLAAPGLHHWMPLAYPAAPAAGAAVLAGVMINAGLLGLLRFLPLGGATLAGWGTALVGIGLTATFYGVAVGLLQRRPGVVLAYSSMSQMGVLIAALGLALAEPAATAPLTVAVTLYAAHHGLAKGGLFLGLELRRRGVPWTLPGLALLALALAGAPLTSGAAAKAALKAALPPEWTGLALALALGSVATTLLMARFLWLVRRPQAARRTAPPLACSAWAALLGLVALFPLLAGTWGVSLSAAGGLALGLALAALALWASPGRSLPLALRLPPGDLPELALRALVRLPAPRLPRPLITGTGFRTAGEWLAARDPEPGLRRWPVAGTLWLALGGLLLWLAAGG